MKTHRPVLTESEIIYITSLLQEHMNTNEIAATAFQKLNIFTFKIQMGLNKGIEHTPRTLKYGALNLGLVESPANTLPSIIHGMTGAQKREILFKRWKHNPALIKTQDEMDAVNTYRWENGLMSPEEIGAFEARAMMAVENAASQGSGNSDGFTLGSMNGGNE